MSPFATLPDLCLLALFKQLPPAFQLSARKVCRQWMDLVTHAARDTRSLAIFVGNGSMIFFEKEINCCSLGSIKVVSLLQKEDGSPMFPLARFNEWNTLHYRRRRDEATVEAIGATFVNLKMLQIGLYCATSSQFDYISRLLELWAHQLTTLKVWELFGRAKGRYVDRFFAAINGLITLERLHLHLDSLPYYDLPIISQLEQLRVYWAECSPHHFAALFHQHATANTSLRTIEYFPINPHSAIKHFTSLGDHLLSRFTRFGCFPHTNSELSSTHFRHLTSLNLEPTATTLRRLFGHLSQLTQLLYLRLHIHFPYLPPDDQPHLLLPQLKSVKALGLSLTIHSHRQLEQLKISWTMPNVEAIQFNVFLHSKCTDCTIEHFSAPHIAVNLANVKHCYRQMFSSLKRTCTKLRAILHDRETILGSADELLTE